VEDAPSIIAGALAAKQPGLVATAAQFIAAHPERASSETITRALAEALERTFSADDVETVSALLDAAGAVRLKEALPKLEQSCRDPNPTLRDHAARALSLVQDAKASCKPKEAAAPAPELGHLLTKPVKLEIQTDVEGLSLTLDPRAAPVAVTRFVDLAREGFYGGVIVHRVVPGFVVQFGDHGGDGFGGASRDPLRCETSPAPFSALKVGVALAGRDTGSSQLFVTLADQPHLDGDYSLVGSALGDWSAVAEGDVLQGIKVVH
jgi:cyclophilin family peptidyl-prolyl cis-trans isomerase